MFLGGKNVKICDFGEKKPSDIGEDLFFSHLLLVEKFVNSARKSLRISAKTSFFGDHLLLVGKFVISARKSLRISAKTFAPPDFNFAPPISRSWRRPWPLVSYMSTKGDLRIFFITVGPTFLSVVNVILPLFCKFKIFSTFW